MTIDFSYYQKHTQYVSVKLVTGIYLQYDELSSRNMESKCKANDGNLFASSVAERIFTGAFLLILYGRCNHDAMLFSWIMAHNIQH